ncbi:MAG TPA: PilZ domain-containing protein [Blastocatellia bacterium]|nr:PilZ domain-containing protein [Blastocatellia bacterium]
MSKDPGQEYDVEQISAYYLELERLLVRVEDASTHYQVLDVDPLATTGEIRLAYMRAAAVLNPSYYGIDVPQAEEMLARVDQAFEKVSQAFSALVNFNKRVEYDNLLFRREGDAAEAAPPPSAEEKRDSGERRAHQRFELTVPARVTGHDRQNGRWQEMTKSVDVSRSGALLRLNHSVRPGMILNLTMPMPLALRGHGHFDLGYSVYAIVRRVVSSEKEGGLIGLEFIGEQPPSAYFDRPWDVFQADKWAGPERRKHPRRRQSEMVIVEYFTPALDYLKREWAFTEDVSRAGLRVCVKAMPAEAGMVRVSTEDDSFNSFATIVNHFPGKDGFHHLCLSLIDCEWPDG